MNIFFYTIIFLIGITFGSFYTLAVYRIPKGEDITHTHSYCPNCNHKLGFLDLIPVFSYIFLGGKCRYCKKPVRIRYLLLEITSGLIFVIAYFMLTMKAFTAGDKSEDGGVISTIIATPILVDTIGNPLGSLLDIANLSIDYPTADKLNPKSLEVLLERKIINVKNAKSLVRSGKLDFPEASEIIEKYEKK